MSDYQQRKAEQHQMRVKCEQESLDSYGTHEAKEMVKQLLEKDFSSKRVYHKRHDLIVCNPIREFMTLRVYESGEISVPSQGSFENYQAWLVWYRSNK